MARMRLGGIAFGAVVAIVGLAGPLWGPGWRALAGYRAAQPLTEAESSALAVCKDPGWTGLSRVLSQDLAVDCPEMWLALTVAGHLGERETRWVRARADSGSQRQQFRYATALLVAGAPVPPDWAFLVSDPGVDARGEVVDAVLTGHLDPGVLDPLLAEDYGRARFVEGDADGRDAVIRTLRRYAARPERASEEERARWSSAALASVGLPGDRLEALLDRKARGLSWQGASARFASLLANRGAGCADRAAPACLVLAADLLEADRRAEIDGGDGGPGALEVPVPQPSRSARALIEILAADASAYAGAAGTLDAWGQWVASAPEEERPRRLLGAVGWPVAGASPAVAGDPVDALTTRAGSPWATAVAALALGEAAGVAVEVHAAGDGVRIVAGDAIAFAGPCGGVRGLRAGTGPAWPTEAVVAQAALEGAGEALRAGRSGEAVRLATFAERLDPIGAAGAVAAITGLREADGSLGRLAGTRITSAPTTAPAGAEGERTERATAWADLAVQWQRGRVWDCPTVLGP